MAEQKQHTGIYKYPGVISTIVTIVVGVVFLGALFVQAGKVDHGADHGAAGDHAAPAAEAAPAGDAKPADDAAGH